MEQRNSFPREVVLSPSLGDIQNQAGHGQLTSCCNWLYFEWGCQARWSPEVLPQPFYGSMKACLTSWLLSSMRQVVLQIGGSQWTLHTLTLAGPSTPSPIMSLKPNWWGVYWITGQEDGWKIGWILNGAMVSSAKSNWQVLFRGGPLKDQYSLMSSLVTWVMGWSALKQVCGWPKIGGNGQYVGRQGCY